MKRLFTMIVLAMVLVGFTAVGAEAGVKNIWPDQFEVQRTDEIVRSPSHVCTNDTTTYFYAVVKLPVGKRITKMKAYYTGFYGNSSVEVWLKRRKMSETSETLAEVVFTGGTSENVVSMVDTSIAFPVVKSGYRYWLNISSNNNGAHLNGVKIFYQD